MATKTEELATFVPNKNLPVYNWFYYKEGYSRELVSMLLDRHARDERTGSPQHGTSGSHSGAPDSENRGICSINVLDPFCGVGTTLLACKERGLDSYGFDVSPLAVLAARAKTNDYDTEEIKKAIKLLQKSKFQRQDIKAVPSNVRQYFNPHTLEDVLFFREQLKNFDSKVLDFVKLGLITSATKCSWMYKDGAVLKVRKKPVPTFRKFYIRTLRKMLGDYMTVSAAGQPSPDGSTSSTRAYFRRREASTPISFRPCQTFVQEADARNMPIDAGFIDLVITSPPYLNKIEYTKIYSVEEFLFFSTPIEKRGLRAFIGVDVEESEPVFPELPPIANAYFSDMRLVFRNLRRVCKKGATVCFVVGDGCLPEGVVHVDTLLPKIASMEGFSLEGVEVLGVRQCTANRVERLGQMEEVLITLRRE